VAGSPVELWAQICRLNREQILDALRALRDELSRLEAALRNGDRFEAILESARQARIRLGMSGSGARSGEEGRSGTWRKR
jgi:prephenate dehydrogenase